jgi:hypothetical protein
MKEGQENGGKMADKDDGIMQKPDPNIRATNERTAQNYRTI